MLWNAGGGVSGINKRRRPELDRSCVWCLRLVASASPTQSNSEAQVSLNLAAILSGSRAQGYEDGRHAYAALAMHPYFPKAATTCLRDVHHGGCHTGLCKVSSTQKSSRPVAGFGRHRCWLECGPGFRSRNFRRESCEGCRAWPEENSGEPSPPRGR